MTLRIPLSERSRQYGYVFWTKAEQEDVSRFFSKESSVHVWFCESYLGEKKIDWHRRRISLGWAQTRPLNPTLRWFRITRRKDNSVNIICS